MKDKQDDTLPPYLSNNSWEKELNYKLWVTKGARFVASRRCKALGASSNMALTFLSSYLIIAGIAPFILEATSLNVGPDLVTLVTTSISVLMLGYSLIEANKGYQLRSYQYHTCAISISKLYNKLRRAKEKKEKEKNEILKGISNEYEQILSNYENHEGIDFSIFKTQKSEYHKLNWIQVLGFRIKYYCSVYLRYHIIIILPPILMTLVLLTAKSPIPTP